jgi:cytochrome c oxidase subunit 2
MNFPFLPERASTFSDQIDALGLLLTVLTIFFTALVFSLLLFFAVRYRRGSKADRSKPQHHNLAMELTWSIIPLVLGLGVFFLAMIPYTQIYNPPANAEEIFVIGKRWMWHLEHTNGIRENNELHVPIGRPFKLTMISQDVIHGFYVPAFRMKRDALPGRYNTVWFEATRPGRYHLFCTEYCGTNHSQMGGWVYVMTPADYATWLKTGSQGAISKNVQTAAEQGRELFSTLACSNCHGNQDTVRAPTLAGIYNRPRKLLSGQIVSADDEYLRGAIRKPEDHLLEGYGQVTTMPAYKEDQLTEEQVHNLIVYIKSLGGAASTPLATGSMSRTTAFAAQPVGVATTLSNTVAPNKGNIIKGTDPTNGTTPTAITGQPASAVDLKSGAQTTSPPSAPSRNTGSTP